MLSETNLGLRERREIEMFASDTNILRSHSLVSAASCSLMNLGTLVRRTSAEPDISIAASNTINGKAVVDLTKETHHGDSNVCAESSNLPPKKRSRLKKQMRVETGTSAHVQHVVHKDTSESDGREPNPSANADNKQVGESKKPSESVSLNPTGDDKENLLEKGDNLHPGKPVLVKRKRNVDTKVDVQGKVPDEVGVSAKKNQTKEEVTKSSNSVIEKKKKPKLTYQDLVLREMFVACKPFNLKSLYQATRSTSESALEFALISLVDKKLISKKDFPSTKGAAKTLYWANLEMANHKDAARALGDQCTEEDMGAAQLEHSKLINQCLQIERAVETLLGELTNDELDERPSQLESELRAIQERIQKAKDFKRGLKTKETSAKDKSPRLMKLRVNAYREEWKSRKEKTIIFVENLADAMEKKVKDVVKLLEIETDEMVGVKIPPKHVVENARV